MTFQYNKILRAYGKFAVEHEQVPIYAHCNIRMQGEKTTEQVIIKLSTDKDAKDDRIFFYCNSLKEFLSHVTDMRDDFVITNFIAFESEIF